jgi:hypothetical protein
MINAFCNEWSRPLEGIFKVGERNWMLNLRVAFYLES